MPTLGEIKRGYDIGLAGWVYIWAACLDCGKERWVALEKGAVSSKRCRDCSRVSSEQRQKISKGNKGRVASPETIAKMRASRKGKYGKDVGGYKGGRVVSRDGYISVLIHPDNFFHPMATKGNYIREHRLVMAKSVGRCLQPFEVVHHKNGIKDDNRLENLELSSYGSHSRNHNKGYKDGYLKGYNDGKDKRIKELEELLSADDKKLRVE